MVHTSFMVCNVLLAKILNCFGRKLIITASLMAEGGFQNVGTTSLEVKLVLLRRHFVIFELIFSAAFAFFLFCYSGSLFLPNLTEEEYSMRWLSLYTSSDL